MIIANRKVCLSSFSNQAGIFVKNGASNKKNLGIPSGDVEKLTNRLEQIEKTLQIFQKESMAFMQKSVLYLHKVVRNQEVLTVTLDHVFTKDYL